MTVKLLWIMNVGAQKTGGIVAKYHVPGMRPDFNVLYHFFAEGQALI